MNTDTVSVLGGQTIGAETQSALREVLARYCRGIDRQDEELIASAYWPDGTDQHGVFNGNAGEFSGWITGFLRQHYTATFHMLGHTLFRDAGRDAVVAETYFMANHGVLQNDTRSMEQISGRYVDRFERRNDEWRIFARIVVIDFLVQMPFPPHGIEKLDTMTFGATDRSDASYRAFR